MDDKLYQLEILHEITMAIGTSLETVPMLDACMPIMLRRLGCTAGCVVRESAPGQFATVYTLPRSIRLDEAWQRACHPASGLGMECHTLVMNGRHHYFWPLPGYGILLLQRAQPLPESIRRELGPIAGKLATALNACVKHERIRAAEELAQVTLDSIGDAVITTDADGCITRLNPVAEALTGWSEVEALGRPMVEIFRIVHEITRQSLESPVERVLREGTVVGLANHTLLIGRHGEEYVIEDSAAPIRADGGTIRGVVLVFRDVTEKHRVMREMEWQARHDALTGLINRREFEQRLEGLLQDARETQSRHALIYLDLDWFKLVNDACGHQAGDGLLRQITSLWKDKVPGADTLARLGGDEFALLLEYCPLERAVTIAEVLLKSLREFRFPCHDRIFHVSASAGVVEIGPTDSQHTVLAAADAACYQAKETGRNRVRAYGANDPDLRDRRQRMDRVSRLTQAIEANQLQLYFQKIFCIDNKRTNHIEILARLNQDGASQILPDSFVPAAERFDLIMLVDRWVVKQALTAHKRQLDRNASLWSINLSGNSLSDEDFLRFLIEEYERCEAPPGTICFEITESAAIANLARLGAFIRRMQERGCLFALDDFGKGLSSFEYLQKLPVDYLKIDGGFVRNINHNATDLAIVESIHRIGHSLGMKTIAEQVEEADILDRLRAIGVDCVQGYFLHRPEPLTPWP